jgi:hypothetical protein
VSDPGFLTVDTILPGDWIKAINDDIQENGQPQIVVTLIP